MTGTSLREFSRRAMESAQRGGQEDALALYSGTSGLREVSFGNPEEAPRRATLAIEANRTLRLRRDSRDPPRAI
jgi:hypothetical protein